MTAPTAVVPAELTGDYVLDPTHTRIGFVARHAMISKVRGSPLPLDGGGECWVTVHPSFLLRIPEPDRRIEERGKFVDDLKRIRHRAAKLTT